MVDTLRKTKNKLLEIKINGGTLKSIVPFWDTDAEGYLVAKTRFKFFRQERVIVWVEISSLQKH